MSLLVLESSEAASMFLYSDSSIQVNYSSLQSRQSSLISCPYFPHGKIDYGNPWEIIVAACLPLLPQKLRFVSSKILSGFLRY